MCRGKNICSELGDRPDKWSKEAPLLPPKWFGEQLNAFCDAVRSAAVGDVANARERLRIIRVDDLREWYVEHGQNSGVYRHRHLGKPKAVTTSSACDTTRSPAHLEKSVFERDGYRCRYCGLRLIPKKVFKAFSNVVGAASFWTTGKTNEERHGVILAFSPIADHVVPWQLGGPTALDNLVTACWSCNYGKGKFTVQQLGLDDPRDRAPRSTADWDGLVSLISELNKRS